MPLIEARGIGRTYKTGDVEVAALRDISLRIAEREFVAFVGPSGSGKSTLLNLVGCLDHPSTGTLTVMGTSVSAPAAAAPSAAASNCSGVSFFMAFSWVSWVGVVDGRTVGKSTHKEKYFVFIQPIDL